MCIVGAGAIGGLLGVRLALAGRQVSVLARGDNLAAIRADGLKLIEPDGSLADGHRGARFRRPCRSRSSRTWSSLALKAHQIAAIADQLSLLYDDKTVVVPLQNGVPWWFFQKFPGPFEGQRLQALDPDGTLDRLIPDATHRRIDRLSGRRARRARA